MEKHIFIVYTSILILMSIIVLICGYVDQIDVINIRDSKTVCKVKNVLKSCPNVIINGIVSNYEFTTIDKLGDIKNCNEYFNEMIIKNETICYYHENVVYTEIGYYKRHFASDFIVVIGFVIFVISICVMAMLLGKKKNTSLNL